MTGRALSRQERRVLRKIAEHLADEDPTLADVLRPTGTPLAQLMRGIPRGGAAATATLFLGPFLIAADVLPGWLLMLTIFSSALSAPLLIFLVLGRGQ